MVRRLRHGCLVAFHALVNATQAMTTALIAMAMGQPMQAQIFPIKHIVIAESLPHS